MPTDAEIEAISRAETDLTTLFAIIPFGIPEERIALDAKGNTWCVLYGLDQFRKLYTPRQLAAFGVFIASVRAARKQMDERQTDSLWNEATTAALSAALSRLADFLSTCVTWTPGGEFLGHTFVRYALPLVWDYCEGNPTSTASGSFASGMDWVSRVFEHTEAASSAAPSPSVLNKSVIGFEQREQFDAIVTDPPYYDAIGYSILMDYFYVWLRRVLYGLSASFDDVMAQQLAPKWDHEKSDGEIIDDASRFDGDKEESRRVYEEGMFRAFKTCLTSLNPEGRMVVVFASKQPEAWESLAAALIRAGFVVDGSWPIQTERQARMRSMSSAALASSVWLVCKKRNPVARPGWDAMVLQQMRANIHQRLRDFWDAGIRGPDFVWAATGPALEAYSQHPVVKKADAPGEIMTVSEFLREVRRLVVDFVVGRVLSRNGDEEAMSGLDDLTTYYLLHRHDFGMNEAPIGACILYATACNLSDRALTDQYDLLARSGAGASAEEEELINEATEESDEAEAETDAGSGAKVKLKTWNQRKGRNLGLEAPGGQPVPLIDQAHRLMHLWKAGEEVKLNEYLEARGLGRNALFAQLLQALIELSVAGSQERSILESLSNHLAGRGGITGTRQRDWVGEKA